MKTLKWRIVLAVINTLAALLFTALALREYRAFSEAHPGAFYHGTAAYIPPSLKTTYTWNAPAFVTAMWIHHVHTSWLGWDCYWFHFGYIEYYVCLFAFWWYLGWGFDKRSDAAGLTRGKAGVIAGIGVGVSLFLIFEAITGIHASFTDSRAIVISTMIWVFGLMCFSGWFLFRSNRRSA